MAKPIQPDHPIWPPFPDTPNDPVPPSEGERQGGDAADRSPQAGSIEIAERNAQVRRAESPGS